MAISEKLRIYKLTISESFPPKVYRKDLIIVTKYYDFMHDWKSLERSVNFYLGNIIHSNSYSLYNYVKNIFILYKALFDFNNLYIRLKPNMYYEYERYKS